MTSDCSIMYQECHSVPHGARLGWPRAAYMYICTASRVFVVCKPYTSKEKLLL